MKNIGDKLNGKNIKAFFINHGEKLGAVCVVAIIVISLATTDWASDERTPDELAAKVSEANEKIAASTWPAEKQKEVPLQNFLAQAESMVEDMNIAPFEYRVSMFEPLVKPPQLITDTKWDSVEELIADSGVVLMELAPEPAQRFPNETYADTTTTAKDDPTNDVDLGNRRRNDVIRPNGVRGGGKGKGKDDYEDDDQFSGINLNIGGGRYAGGKRTGNTARDRDSGRGRGRNARSNRLGGNDSETEPMARARGQRFAAIRGLFDVRKQKINLANALRLPLPSDADKRLQFRGFRIQRQRALAGPDPWKEENWEELDIEEAVRVLADANGFALPILDPRVTNHYITMPMPPRLEGYWAYEATHPRLEQFKLSDEEREQIEEVTKLVREQVEEQLRKDDDKSGGFAGIAEDITKIRRRASEKQMAELRKKVEQAPKSVDERVKEIFGLTAPADGAAAYGRLGGQNLMVGRGGMGDALGGTNRGFGGGIVRGRRDKKDRSSQSGFGGFGLRRPTPASSREILTTLDAPQPLRGIEAAIGRVLLFRYLDFTVKPGEAYRYRVKLLFDNPAYNAYNREQVDDEAVIQGETRESDWSEPSQVVVIPPDTHAFVTNANVDDEPGRNGANFEIYQWHQGLGTIIHDKMRCIFGQFIGGTKSTLVLNLAKPSFDSEPATFTSSMALVDATEEPKINLADHPDLKVLLEGRNSIRADRETSIGIPAEALVVKEDGRTVRMDSMSQIDRRNELDKDLNIVRGQYDDLRDSGDRMSERDKLFESGRLDRKDRGGRRDRGSSSLRKGKRHGRR